MAYDGDFEKLNDGLWHWVKSGPELGLKSGQKNELWVSETPSKPGYYPKERDSRITVDYYPEADDFVYMGNDMYANNGQVVVWDEPASAVVMPWPMPEFMSSQDNSWFMRLWTEEELQAGHFHFPLFFIIEHGTLRDLAASERSTQIE